jgi:ankyrin repeat protein/beta-lactamase regulating signal transducer with metallopeptidase domain
MYTYTNQIASYLLAQSWQIAVLASIVGLISLALRNRSAHIRYLLWLIVLAKCLVPPYLTIPLAVLPQRAFTEQSKDLVSPEMTVRDIVAADTVDAMKVEQVLETPQSKSSVPNAREAIFVTWLVGVLLFLLWVCTRAVRYTLWLRRRRTPLPLTMHQSFQELFAGFRLKKLPRIWLINDIAQPFVWGLLRGSVYIPADFVDLDNSQRHRSILAHELSHTVRFDAGINMLQVLAQAIYWFHPFVWWMNRKIRQEREKSCDEMAIAHLSEPPERYTNAIVDALIAERGSTRPVPSLAIVGSIKDIEERIKSMLRPGKKFQRHPSLAVTTIVALITLLVVSITVVVTAKAENDATSSSSGRRWTNSLGMVFVPVKGTDVRFCVWETRVKDFEAFIKATGRNMDNKMMCFNRELKQGVWEGYNWKNPGFTQGPNHPVVGVNWEDAVAFCKWLTEKERKEGILPLGRYRLPSDLEWSAAVGLIKEKGSTPEEKREKEGVYPWGEQWPPPKGAGNYADMTTKKKYKSNVLQTIEGYDDGFAETAPVGSFNPNLYGLYDMGGNVLEWCGYWVSADVDEYRALRGASWSQGDQNVQGHVSTLLSSYRIGVPLSRAASPENRGSCIGFRVVLDAPESGNKPTKSLHEAASDGDIEQVKLLISKGADINSKDPDGQTPLHLAARHGQIRVAELLIAKGADVNARDKRGERGETPLYYAADAGWRNVAELLIAKGADVNARGSGGTTALESAAWRGRGDVAKLLIAKGADVMAKSDYDYIPLHAAAESGLVEVAELLIAKGSDPDAKDKGGMRPLHLAIGNEPTHMVEVLIAKGADVNSKNANGQTPLHLSVRQGHRDMVELLITKSADVNARNKWNRTPLDIAVDQGHTEIVELLRKHGAKE